MEIGFNTFFRVKVIQIFKSTYCRLLRTSLLKGIPSKILENIRRSCIIITKCCNSPSPILQYLESVTQVFSRTSPNFRAIIKIRSKRHTFSEGFGEAPGNEYVLRPLYLHVPFYKWYLLGIATPMPRQPLFPDIYNYSHPSQLLTTVITVTFKSPFKCLSQ